MLTFEQIKELIDLVARHHLSGVELERSGFRLKVEGQVAAAAAPPAPLPLATNLVAPAPAAASVATSSATSEAPATAPAAREDAHILTSPIVGTFYGAPNPESAPFVEVGDKVKKGQVLCIVEAMKLMNEIESDVDGTITEIFPKDAQAVEFGERLFAITVS